jgi:hypothetical protein
MVVIAAVPGDTSVALFFPAIYIIAVGTGGIKPNVSTMGSDQFDDRYSRDRVEKESFFNWYAHTSTASGERLTPSSTSSSLPPPPRIPSSAQVLLVD